MTQVKWSGVLSAGAPMGVSDAVNLDAHRVFVVFAVLGPLVEFVVEALPGVLCVADVAETRGVQAADSLAPLLHR